jgi:DNA invertase Pin-like site-specific DNA recombinase
VHDPTDPGGRLLFNVLAMVAEFEAGLIRARTRDGMKVAKAKGRLRGKQPKLSPMQEAHLVGLYRAGEHTVSELEELFGVTRSTAYRTVRRRQRRHGPGGRSRERRHRLKRRARAPTADAIPATRRRVIRSTPRSGRRSATPPPSS